MLACAGHERTPPRRARSSPPASTARHGRPCPNPPCWPAADTTPTCERKPDEMIAVRLLDGLRCPARRRRRILDSGVLRRDLARAGREHHCLPYKRYDYPYSQSIKPRIVTAGGASTASNRARCRQRAPNRHRRGCRTSPWSALKSLQRSTSASVSSLFPSSSLTCDRRATSKATGISYRVSAGSPNHDFALPVFLSVPDVSCFLQSTSGSEAFCDWFAPSSGYPRPCRRNRGTRRSSATRPAPVAVEPSRQPGDLRS